MEGGQTPGFLLAMMSAARADDRLMNLLKTVFVSVFASAITMFTGYVVITAKLEERVSAQQHIVEYNKQSSSESDSRLEHRVERNEQRLDRIENRQIEVLKELAHIETLIEMHDKGKIKK